MLSVAQALHDNDDIHHKHAYDKKVKINIQYMHTYLHADITRTNILLSVVYVYSPESPHL